MLGYSVDHGEILKQLAELGHSITTRKEQASYATLKKGKEKITTFVIYSCSLCTKNFITSAAVVFSEWADGGVNILMADRFTCNELVVRGVIK